MNIPFFIMALLPLLLSPSLSAADQRLSVGAQTRANPAYTIQIGAYADKNNANGVVALLKRNNVSAIMIRNSKGLYVVQSGRYSAMESARAAALRLQRNGIIKEFGIAPLANILPLASGKAPPESAQKESVEATDNQHITQTAQTVQTRVTTMNSMAASVVTHTPEPASGRTRTEAVLKDINSGLALARSRPVEVVEQREHGARLFPAMTEAIAPRPLPDSTNAKTAPVSKPASPPAVARIAKYSEKKPGDVRVGFSNDIFGREHALLQEQISVSAVMAFLKKHGAVLKQCGRADVFYNLAAYCAANGKPEEATAIYRSLLSCSGDEGLQLGALYALKPLLPHSELLALAEQKRGARNISAKHRAKLETYTVELLQGLLAAEPGQLEKNALALLRIRPDDSFALSSLGWLHFNKQRYEEAYSFFKRMNSAASGQTGRLEGMIYSLAAMERLDEALDLATHNRRDRKIAKLMDEVRLKQLWGKVASTPPDSPEIGELAEKILQISPDNEDIRVVLAWRHYNRQEFEKAYQEFSNLYNNNRSGKGYAYALASAMVKLNRYDEAAAIAADNKQSDKRLTAFETSLYLERARSAYNLENYREAEIYFSKVVAAEPDDEESKSLLESAQYRKTFVAGLLSPIAGLPGHTWGSLNHDFKGGYGSGASLLLNQGIDWVMLPWDVKLRTYGEAWLRTRTQDARYYDLFGQALGIELKKSIFSLGAEYAWERYTRQKKGNTGGLLFLSWYDDWYKYLYDNSDDASWFNIHALSGHTYGKLSHDFGGITGTGITGNVNQGVDWLRLPGDIVLNSFVEYRFNFRTGDNKYYNEHGPAVGTELQRLPFKLGAEYYWGHETERNLRSRRATVYLKWYYDWDLKPKK